MAEPSFFSITDADGDEVLVASEVDDEGIHTQVFALSEED